MSNHRLPELTDEEEARIQAGIAADPDNPEWTEEDFANARPFAEVFPEWAAQIERDRVAGFGYVPVDLNILTKLKESGPDWRDRVNEILRKAVGL